MVLTTTNHSKDQLHAPADEHWYTIDRRPSDNHKHQESIEFICGPTLSSLVDSWSIITLPLSHTDDCPSRPHRNSWVCWHPLCLPTPLPHPTLSILHLTKLVWRSEPASPTLTTPVDWWPVDQSTIAIDDHSTVWVFFSFSNRQAHPVSLSVDWPKL